MHQILRFVGTINKYNMRKEDHSVTIASKISRSDKQKLHVIADELGITFYGLVQAILCTIVRYWDKGSAVTAEHRIMISAFSNVLASVIGSHNPVSRRNVEKNTVKSAILLVERKAGQRPQVMEVRKNEQGNIVESYNLDTMLSSFLGAVDPNALHCLEAKAKEIGSFSISQTMHQILLEQSAPPEDNISAEICDLFSDIRIPTGNSINSDVHYKQARRSHIDEYTTIQQKQSYRADL